VLSLDRIPPCNSSNARQCSSFFYDVKLSNLLSNTRYYYQIQDDSVSGQEASQVYNVKTAIGAGDSTPYSAFIYGDLGFTNAANTRFRMLESIDTTDFALHVGDLSYADDWHLTLQGEPKPNGGDESDSYTDSWDKWQVSEVEGKPIQNNTLHVHRFVYYHMATRSSDCTDIVSISIAVLLLVVSFI